MSPFRLQLRGRSPTVLLIFGGLLVLAAALVSALVVWNSHRQAEAAAASAMVRSARLLEQGLTRSLESLDAALLRIAEPLALDGGLATARAAMREAIRFAPHIRQILVLDTDGRVVLDSAGQAATKESVDASGWGLGPGAPRSLGSSLRLGVAVPGRYLVGEQAEASAAAHWVVPVELSGEGGTYRVIAALNPDFFLRAFAAVLSGPVEEALLVRYDGAVLATLGDSAGLTRPPWGWSVEEGLRTVVQEGAAGRQIMATPLRDQPGAVAVRLSEVYPVAVALAFSRDGLTAEWLEAERGPILALGVAPVLLGLLALAVLVLLRHRLHLRRELRVLSRVVEEAPVAVIVTDRDGQIEFVNDSFTRLLGYQPSEIVGRTPALLKSGHSDSAVYQELWRTILTGCVWHGEFLNRAKDGRLLWMSAAVSGVRDDDGQVRRYVAVEADVTERKRAEATLSAMVGRLEASNRELEQFARVASHDLQEPLRMVTGYLSLLQRRSEGLLPEESRGFIRNAVNGADRMRGLIKDLLAYSQVSNRQVALRAVDTEKALQAALGQLQDKIVATGATIRRDPLPMVLAEERNLATLFVNLLDNALTHRHPARPPEIEITCTQATAPGEGPEVPAAVGRYWAIAVRDNGLGIDPRDFDRVFRLFQHLQAREDAQGNGVGLAVARRIAERAGGAISVDSDGASGSTFLVLLPRADGAAGQPGQAPLIAAASAR